MVKLGVNPPEPDFEALRRTLLRQGEPERVHVLELLVDREIIAAIAGVNAITELLDQIEEARWTRMTVQMWVDLGADAVNMRPIYALPFGRERTEDTAALRRKEREWATAEAGLIKTWEDFARYPWPDPKDYDYSQIEFAARLMPQGMKILGYIRGVLEPAMWIMSYDRFATALYDAPDLVKAVTDKVAEIHIPVVM